MRIVDDAATIWRRGPPLYEDWACLICNKIVNNPPSMGPSEEHAERCAWRSMEQIADFVEQATASMHRVWTKAVESGRGDWPEFAEMGDLLYHATDGKMGACGRYSSCNATDPELTQKTQPAQDVDGAPSSRYSQE